MQASNNAPYIDPEYEYLKFVQSIGDHEERWTASYGLAEGWTRRVASTREEDQIPIFAKISNLVAWQQLQTVQHGMHIAIDQEHWIVTARIPLDDFEVLNSLPFVNNLKVARAVYPLLNDTITEMGLDPHPPFPHRPSTVPRELLSQGGKHVVVGIVDYGCAFAHKNFIKPSGKTRIHAIWNQRAVAQNSQSQGPYGIGVIYTREQINEAIQQQDPYTTLGYHPRFKRGKDVKELKHGTHVMDIAAGSGYPEKGLFPGVAPKAKIIFVDLSFNMDPLGKKNSTADRLVGAVEYIFKEAERKNRPCVVNLSLGTQGGAHDGTSYVEQTLDTWVKEIPNRAIVIAAGNSYKLQSHRSGAVGINSFVEILWTVQNDELNNQLEIWYSGKDEFVIEILYNSQLLKSLSLGDEWNRNLDDNIHATFSHKTDPTNSDHQFFLQGKFEKGPWTFRLHGKRIRVNGEFHAWIERGSPSIFEKDNPQYTLNSIATGQKSIVVGAYNAHEEKTPIGEFSSSGPTRKGQQKPEVSAPGCLVKAAHSLTTDRTLKMSGTSMAAPAVTGLVARILGQAYENRINLNVDEIREILISTCQKNPPSGRDWDPRYGYGRVSATAILGLIKSKVTDDNPKIIEDKKIDLPSLPKAKSMPKAKPIPQIKGFTQFGDFVKKYSAGEFLSNKAVFGADQEGLLEVLLNAYIDLPHGVIGQANGVFLVKFKVYPSILSERLEALDSQKAVPVTMPQAQKIIKQLKEEKKIDRIMIPVNLAQARKYIKELRNV